MGACDGGAAGRGLGGVGLTPILAAISAVVSAAAVAVGVWLVFAPAGLITAGMEGLFGSYVAARVWAQTRGGDV